MADLALDLATLAVTRAGVEVAVTPIGYQRTADAWLANMDLRRDRIEPLFASVSGVDAPRWWVRWRVGSGRV